MARVRSPTASVSSSLVTGSSAAQTQWGERDNRWMASASLTSPVFTALSRAKSSSSCTCVTRTSWRKYCEKAAACSATSTSQARTVLGSTSNTRATARMPKPSASAPMAHTNMSGDTRLPRSEEHTSELQSQSNLVCRLLLEKKKKYNKG